MRGDAGSTAISATAHKETQMGITELWGATQWMGGEAAKELFKDIDLTGEAIHARHMMQRENPCGHTVSMKP